MDCNRRYARYDTQRQNRMPVTHMSFDVAEHDEATLEAHEYRIKRCRAQECRARIIWLRAKDGRPHPTDADSVEPGDVEFDTKKGHVSHFATCPAAARFRKAK